MVSFVVKIYTRGKIFVCTLESCLCQQEFGILFEQEFEQEFKKFQIVLKYFKYFIWTKIWNYSIQENFWSILEDY